MTADNQFHSFETGFFLTYTRPIQAFDDILISICHTKLSKLRNIKTKNFMSIYEMTVGFGYVVSMQMESIKLKLLVKLIYEKHEILQRIGMMI